MTTSRLLLYDHNTRGHYPFLQHRLYPAILECCQMCNEEGAPFLYGENAFTTAWCRGRPNHGGWRVLNSWPTSRRSLCRISKLAFSIYQEPTQSEDSFALSQKSTLFPNLKHIKLDIRLSVLQWEAFLDLHADLLKTLQKIEFRVTVDMKEAREPNEDFQSAEGRLVRDEYDCRWEVRNADVMSLQLYEPALQKHGRLGKKIEKEFRDLSSSYGLHWIINFNLW